MSKRTYVYAGRLAKAACVEIYIVQQRTVILEVQGSCCKSFSRRSRVRGAIIYQRKDLILVVSWTRAWLFGA